MIWSKSKLKTFRQCPLAFKLSYIDGIKIDIKIEALDKGIKLHELFEKFYLFYKGDINHAIDVTINELGLTEDFVNKYLSHIENFKHFNKQKMQKFGKDFFYPVITEKWYEFGKWHGIIDRVDKIKDRFILIDYKTSNGVDLSDYIDELILYAWLVKMVDDITINYVGIYFTANGKLVLKRITDKEINETMNALNKEIDLYEQAIKQRSFPAQQGYWCQWCQYKDTEYCPYSKRGK